MINVFAFCHLLNTVFFLVSLQRQTFPSLTMNHTTTTTPTNTYYFSKLDNATHCLSLSLTMSPLILTMSPAAANLLLLCTHPLSHIVPPHLPVRSSCRPSCTHLWTLLRRLSVEHLGHECFFQDQEGSSRWGSGDKDQKNRDQQMVCSGLVGNAEIFLAKNSNGWRRRRWCRRRGRRRRRRGRKVGAWHEINT